MHVRIGALRTPDLHQQLFPDANTRCKPSLYSPFVTSASQFSFEMAIGGASSLPYNEPSIVSILLITSFILLLNIVNYCLDNVLYCGLIGQILIGVAYGTPGAKWLDDVTETTINQLGYLGLILLVYEGASHINHSQLALSPSITYPLQAASPHLSSLSRPTSLCLSQ